MLALFLFEIKNDALAGLIITTFALIAITAMISDYDEIEIGVIKIKRRKEKEDVNSN